METELRPLAEKRYHRVIVNVTDDEIADNMLGNAMSTMLRPRKFANSSERIPSKNLDADINVLNCTTLSLNQKHQSNAEERTNQIMFFDCVGRTESDPLVRYEIGSLFDLLMIDRRNCCFVNFKPMRARPSNFFNSVVVPEIDKRLMLLQGTMALRSIKLEYYDVRKYDVVNMCKNMKGAPFKKSSNNELFFQNTRELLRWTQQTYPSIWVNGSEHECFDLEFTFIEAASRLNGRCRATETRVKLSILLCYFNKMDGDLRVGLRSFFENVSRTDLRFKHSILTDYLREYFFKEEDSWQIWMLFDVPSVNIGSSLASDMLTLARAAYVGVHNINMEVNSRDFDLAYESNASRKSGGRNSISLISPVSTTSTCSSQKSKTATRNPTKLANYSLSFWYLRLDESCANVITSLERYYDRKYELRVQKLCGDVQRKSQRNRNDERYLDADEIVQNYYKLYKDALADFRVLVKKVERTKHADKFADYIKTKNIEIAKLTRQMRLRLLELCQARISNTVRDEVKTMNTVKNVISKISHELIKTVDY